MWLREVKSWRVATLEVKSLKDVHGLQLALHLPEGTEIRRQIFDTFEPEQMQGDEGWKRVIELIENCYKKDDNTEAYESWNEIRSVCRKPGQTVDEYIMAYEKCKTRMERKKMNIGERIHGLNIMCGADLNKNDLNLAMREVDGEQPQEMFSQAKKAFKEVLW